MEWFLASMMLLIPAVMLLGGWIMEKRTPRRNFWLGYRTERSMASDEAWQLANRFCGRLWLRWGGMALAVTAIVLVAVLLLWDVKALAIVSLVALLAQTVLLFASIPVVERALKQ